MGKDKSMAGSGIITYNKKNSTDFGLRMLLSSLTVPVPDNDVSFNEVTGVNGDFLTSNGRYKNVTWTFPYQLATSSEDTVYTRLFEITDWLRDSTQKDYRPLYFDLLPEGYFIEGIPYTSLNMQVETYWRAKVDIQFYAKPFLKNILGQKPISLPTNTVVTLQNREVENSYPIIKLSGSGSATVTIDNENFFINQLNGNLIINSEINRSYLPDGTPQDMYMDFGNGDFPELKTGFTKVKVTGTGITSAEIIPNWMRLI